MWQPFEDLFLTKASDYVASESLTNKLNCEKCIAPRSLQWIVPFLTTQPFAVVGV